MKKYRLKFNFVSIGEYAFACQHDAQIKNTKKLHSSQHRELLVSQDLTEHHSVILMHERSL